RWSKNIELDQKQVESFLGERVAGFIQSDYYAAVNSINLGQPLITSAPNSKVAADLQSLAVQLFDVNLEPVPVPTGRSTFNSLFKRQAASNQDIGLITGLERVNLGEAQ
ncbi:MAG: hypothetical protein C5B55_03510, partial [Blastocatellia bacterium]